jgi:hypothetical protein
MSGQRQDGVSPFRPAETTDRRLKALFWGASGTGKTTLSLRFPGVVVVDMEGGTEHYGDAFKFEVLKATTADDVMRAVDWLLTHPHPYRTLVIDPITLYWDAVLRKWTEILMRRNRGSKGHNGEYYVMQPKDWMHPKSELKDFIRKLIQLDMNVIVTARQKTQYSDAGFMRVVGETFDAEKTLPYVFDTILRLSRDDAGRFMAENLKDRTNKLPRGKFEVSYELIEKCLGSETLTREAAPLHLAAPEQVDRIRQFIASSGMKQEQVAQRLAAYGATCIEDLTEENAQIILDKFATAAAGKTPAATTLT